MRSPAESRPTLLTAGGMSATGRAAARGLNDPGEVRVARA